MAAPNESGLHLVIVHTIAAPERDTAMLLVPVTAVCFPPLQTEMSDVKKVWKRHHTVVGETSSNPAESGSAVLRVSTFPTVTLPTHKQKTYFINQLLIYCLCINARCSDPPTHELQEHHTSARKPTQCCFDRVKVKVQSTLIIFLRIGFRVTI